MIPSPRGYPYSTLKSWLSYEYSDVQRCFMLRNVMFDKRKCAIEFFKEFRTSLSLKKDLYAEAPVSGIVKQILQTPLTSP